MKFFYHVSGILHLGTFFPGLLKTRRNSLTEAAVNYFDIYSTLEIGPLR